MIFINAYFDESLPGQEDDSGLPPEFCVVAGFAQQAHLWIDFSVEWGKILALPKAIEYFHSVEANGRRDQFEGFTRPERDQKVIALIDVIKGHRPLPLISAVLDREYQELLIEFPGVMPNDPYIFCLHNLIIEVAELNDRRKISEPFLNALIFENNQAMRKKAETAFDMVMADRPDFTAIFTPLAFGDKKRYKPLQAADALAYDSNKQFTTFLHNPRAKVRRSLQEILSRVPPTGLHWPWPYKDLRRLFEDRYRKLTMGE